MQKKNITLLGITFLTLIFFIIAAYGFGFQSKGTTLPSPIPPIPSYKWTLSDLSASTSQAGPAYAKDAYGLMVSGMVFISLTVIASGTLIGLSTNKVKFENKTKILKWIKIGIYAFVGLSVLLMFSGELTYLDKSVKNINKILEELSLSGLKFNEYWKGGTVAGMLIFTLLPLPLLAVPYFIKK